MTGSSAAPGLLDQLHELRIDVGEDIGPSGGLGAPDHSRLDLIRREFLTSGRDLDPSAATAAFATTLARHWILGSVSQAAAR